METKFDLEERTAKFGRSVILLCQKANKSVVINPIINQLVKSGTSIGANYHEANGASSKKDFVNKIYISKKEAKETQYWLEMLVTAQPDLSEECLFLKQEAKELAMIFSSITSKCKT